MKDDFYKINNPNWRNEPNLFSNVVQFDSGFITSEYNALFAVECLSKVKGEATEEEVELICYAIVGP